MGGNLFGQFNYTQANVPMVTIAAIFQKEPQVLLAHPDSGVQQLADLDDKTFFISNDGRQTYWLWLKQVYGFSDDQVKPYTFNASPESTMPYFFIAAIEKAICSSVVSGLSALISALALVLSP